MISEAQQDALVSKCLDTVLHGLTPPEAMGVLWRVMAIVVDAHESAVTYDRLGNPTGPFPTTEDLEAEGEG